ncbi:MAG: glutamate synthase subunit beta [Rhodospirillales bacterium]|nr:glutamate synthase subunit beta [Rhodospirillales bacterium]
MGKPTGFVEIQRQGHAYEPVSDRIRHFDEFVLPMEDGDLRRQGARCMDCGIPFCHSGCPVSNIIPDWNDLVYRKRWREALDVLHSTNNFPEFTGRVCPAPCEQSCTLNLQHEPVTIKNIECAIVDKAWEEGWVRPQIPAHRTSKRVAVVGSGPAGLACAQQLARAGHHVVVCEKNARIGGLLRYGIPDFKMNKLMIDRRMGQMQAEGVKFLPGVNVGVDVTAETLLEDFDAVVLAGGSEQPRDLPVPGRELDGIHFAMDFLTQQNRRLAGEKLGNAKRINAQGKRVIVIGGGDTGSDCIGTSIRQEARWVTQFEILPQPPEREDSAMTWPDWPDKLMTTSSQEEGCRREWTVATKRFLGEDGVVTGLEAVRVEWHTDADGRMTMSEIPDSAFEVKADLVLLAMGFVHPVHEGMLAQFGVDLDGRGNVAAETGDYQTSVEKVFSAGDMRRGQSLVVWAIREGRQCARSVDAFLMGETGLPR